MYAKSKTIRLIPSEPGRGGTNTAVSTQNKITDTFEVFNATVFLGRWAAATAPYQTGLYAPLQTMGYTPDSSALSQVLSNFATIDTTNSTLTPTNRLMQHVYDSTVTGNENAIFDHSIFNHAGWVAYSANSGGNNYCVPATFLSIRNRDFICWGGNGTTTWSDSTKAHQISTNNLIYQPTAATTWNAYDIGVHQPLTAATYIYDSTAVKTGNTSVTNGSNKVNNPTSSGNWSSSTLGINLGGVAYVVQSPGGYVTSFSTSGTATATNGTPTVTINGFLWPTNGDWNGLTFTSNSHSYVVQSYTLGVSNTTVTLTTNITGGNLTTAAYTVTGEELVLTSAYTGGTTLSQAYTAGTGALSWTGAGPQYTYCYYDAVTGHVSNPAPVTQVTEQNQQNVNIILQNIAYSTHGSEGYRFIYILIFRTLSSGGGISGGVMYPMGNGSGAFNISVGNSTAGSGVTTFTDNFSDSYLLVNSGLTAPISMTNRAPVGQFAHMTYWDGRVWGNPVSDPTAVYFSCDVVQCPFGVAEESFPSTNLLRIPAEDGRVTGMKLVGAYNVITTNRYSYYVSGNNEQNYRLLKFASTTSGVGDYQMVEFAGDTTDNAAALVYLGSDAKIYMNSPTYGNQSMSDPIQDLLWSLLGNNQTLFSQVKLATLYVGTQKFLLASVPLTATLRIIMLYDFDRKVWTLHEPGFATLGVGGIPFSAFTTAYQSRYTTANTQIVPSSILMGWQGSIWNWFLQPTQLQTIQGSAPFDPAYVLTFPLDFGRKSKKQLNQVRIYVNVAGNQIPGTPGNTQNWTINVTVNEAQNLVLGTPTTYVPVLNQDPQYQLQGGLPLAGTVTGTPFPVDAFDARELVLDFPSDAVNPIVGNRFQIKVNFPTANLSANLFEQWPYQLYAIDVVATDLNDGSDESP